MKFKRHKHQCHIGRHSEIVLMGRSGRAYDAWSDDIRYDEDNIEILDETHQRLWARYEKANELLRQTCYKKAVRDHAKKESNQRIRSLNWMDRKGLSPRQRRRQLDRNIEHQPVSFTFTEQRPNRVSDFLSDWVKFMAEPASLSTLHESAEFKTEIRRPLQIPPWS